MTSDPRDDVRAYYRGFAGREWDRLASPADGAVELLVTTDALARHLPPASRVLDIGGGPGRYALWLAERGHRVTLADLSPELLAIARERLTAAPPDVRDRVEAIVEVDAVDLGRWADATFDAALSLGPFYHLPDPRERSTAIGELARVVRPGGVVFVAAMPRLALLQRTIALEDERHRLLDDSWLNALLEHGVFTNDVRGRFTGAHGVDDGEAESWLTEAGFDVLEVSSAESLSLGIEAAVAAVLEEDGPLARSLRQLLLRHARDPRVLGLARHLLLVGRKRSGGR